MPCLARAASMRAGSFSRKCSTLGTRPPIGGSARTSPPWASARRSTYMNSPGPRLAFMSLRMGTRKRGAGVRDPAPGCAQNFPASTVPKTKFSAGLAHAVSMCTNLQVSTRSPGITIGASGAASSQIFVIPANSTDPLGFQARAHVMERLRAQTLPEAALMAAASPLLPPP